MLSKRSRPGASIWLIGVLMFLWAGCMRVAVASAVARVAWRVKHGMSPLLHLRNVDSLRKDARRRVISQGFAALAADLQWRSCVCVCVFSVVGSRLRTRSGEDAFLAQRNAQDARSTSHQSANVSVVMWTLKRLKSASSDVVKLHVPLLRFVRA